MPHRIEHIGNLRGLTQAVSEADGASVLKVSGAPEHMKRRIATFFMKEARSDLEKLVAVHVAAGAPVRSISIQRTREADGVPVPTTAT